MPLARPRSPTRSGRSRSAARRRSGSPPPTATRSPPRAGRTSTRRPAPSPPRVRRRSTSPGRSASCVPAGGDPGELAPRAREIHRDEVERCRRMAEHAAELFGPGTRAAHALQHGRRSRRAATAPRSARSGAAFERGLVEHVFVDETRPLLQGAPPDGLGARARRRPARRDRGRGRGRAHGARRGRRTSSPAPTGSLRTATSRTRSAPTRSPSSRAHHGLPLYVVAPTSTVDLATPSRRGHPDRGARRRRGHGRFPARNPAFDVTPAGLVTAIVTEEGVHRPPYAESLRAASTMERVA